MNFVAPIACAVDLRIASGSAVRADELAVPRLSDLIRFGGKVCAIRIISDHAGHLGEQSQRMLTERRLGYYTGSRLDSEPVAVGILTECVRNIHINITVLREYADDQLGIAFHRVVVGTDIIIVAAPTVHKIGYQHSGVAPAADRRNAAFDVGRPVVEVAVGALSVPRVG